MKLGSYRDRTTSGLTMDVGGAVSELCNLEHDIEHGFPSSSGQEQGRVTDLIDSDDLIYSVPTDMANKQQQQHVFEKEMPFDLFSPCIVSIGPLNFDPSSSSLMGNEIKKEALRKMLKDHAPASGFGKALIGLIEKREEEIKECYADRAKIPDYLSGSTFAGIMLLDSCFLLQVIYLIAYNGKVNKDEWPSLATVFEDRHMKAMVIQDIFKIGNQIPLFVVQEVAKAFEKSFEDAIAVAKAFEKSFEEAIAKTLRNICPLCSYPPVDVLVGQVRTLCSSKKPHLLSMLHRFMCGSFARETDYKVQPQFSLPFEDIVAYNCADYFVSMARQLEPICQLGRICEAPESANFLSRVAWTVLRWIVTFALVWPLILFGTVSVVLWPVSLGVTVACGFVVVLVVVILLLPFFIIACLWPQQRIKQEEASSPWFRVKAENLAHHISIKSYMGEIKDICYNSSLYLPRINVGETSGVLLHNMIAMERCSQRVHKKTVCNYVILMAKLLQTPTDVQVLEHRNVLEKMDMTVLEHRSVLERMDRAVLDDRVVSGLTNVSAERTDRASFAFLECINVFQRAFSERRSGNVFVAMGRAFRECNNVLNRRGNDVLNRRGNDFERMIEWMRRAFLKCKNFFQRMGTAFLEYRNVLERMEDINVSEWMDRAVSAERMDRAVLARMDVEVSEDIKVLRGMHKDRSRTVRMFQGLQKSAAAAEVRFSDWTDGCLKTLTQLQEDRLPKLPRWKEIIKSTMFWVKDLGRRYAANPWVALSTAAAATLLLMTGAQVVCLFRDCNSSSSKS